MQTVHLASHPAPCPEPFNLAAYVLAHADRLADKTALQILRPTGAERWSYAKLQSTVRGTATGLLALGLPQGAKILLRLGNGPEFPVAFLGAIAAGFVPVPTSAELTHAEITRMAASLAPDLVIAEDGIAAPDGIHLLSAQDLRSFADLPPAPYDLGSPERLAYMVYTSGTSGQPRAVMHAHRAVWARQMMHRDWYDLRESDRVLHAGAFNWTYTLGTGLLDPWSVGATALIPQSGVETRTIPLLLKRFDATIFAAAPGVYGQILKHHTKISAPKLRHGLSAGETMSAGLKSAWETATTTPVYEALGLSECSTFLSAAPTRPAPTGMTGWPQRGRRIAVLLEDGEISELSSDVSAACDVTGARDLCGELLVHESDQGLFLGYHNAADETAARRQGDWFRTGDTVRICAQTGAAQVLGRQSDLMNAGGFRVSPLEVERAFETLAQAGDFAAAELRLNEDVSIIALGYTGDAPREAFEARAARDLARYKQPRAYLRLDGLPSNANGKLNRARLAAKLAQLLRAPTESPDPDARAAPKSSFENPDASG